MTTARPLLLIVPSADDRPTTHRLLGVAAALAEDPTVDLTVLLWAGGSSAEAFAALSPTCAAKLSGVSTDIDSREEPCEQ